MAKLNELSAFDGAALPTRITTTYRVIPSGTEVHPEGQTEGAMPQTPRLSQWLRRQHPADVVRIILMAIAIGAVIVAIVRLG